MSVIAGACHDDSHHSTKRFHDEADVVLAGHIYGECDAYVVTDRTKGIDISSQDKFFRPAVFKIEVAEGVPAAVEILMLASDDDHDEPLYPRPDSLLQIAITQQPDLLLGGGKEERYRGVSETQQDNIEIGWSTETGLELDAPHSTEHIVRVDLASDPYDGEEGERRWGKHYVCHRNNADIAALERDSYTSLVEQATAE